MATSSQVLCNNCPAGYMKNDLSGGCDSTDCKLGFVFVANKGC